VTSLAHPAIAEPRNLAGRLTRAALESSGIALVVAGLAINLLVYAGSLADLQREASMHARMAGDASSAALLFGDAKAADDTLAFLRGWPEVESATIVDSHGQRFATYRSPDAARSEGTADGARVLTVSEPVLEDGHQIGRIDMSVSLGPLMHQAWMLAGVTALSAVLGLTFAFLRVRRVRRAVGRAEAERDRLAFFDPVTGLYNRHAAQAFLGRAVKRTNEPFAVALLDLDDFKLVNDTLGHSAGDELLCCLGERLGANFAAAGAVFRLGGDEFIVVCPGVVGDVALKRLGRRVVDALSESLAAAGKAMSVRGSVGVAAFPAHGSTAQQLLRAADTAMYQAKASGKNTHALYDESMAAASAAQLQLCTEFGLALERQELELHYQPIVELASGGLIGTEALVRWRHPERGLLNAGQFIAAAESSGLVVPLGGWVLQAAARQQAEWARSGLGHLFIAVNASAKQFKRNVLQEQVGAALAATGADPRRLQIELTEHTLVEDVSANVQTLASLRALGIKIAIDDFGTGLSSLAYLKRLPIDKLKIDRSFVEDMTAGDEDTAIVATIVSLAQALRLEVVAEGIETARQRDLLRRLGAQHGQGWFFGKPVPADRIAQLAGAGRAAPAPCPAADAARFSGAPAAP
jgi:diguanylate cyclase (GGDEF)-like protein